MTEAATLTYPICIDCGVAGAPLAGQQESGDLHVVVARRHGALVAVIDGLGHGPRAATASRLAAQTLQGHADEPPVELVQRCHDRLHGTRGAVITLATVNATDHLLTWIGVGNVEAVLLRASPDAGRTHEAIMLRGGVVGDRLPTLGSTVHSLEIGDTLILATDGIQSGFYEHVELGPTPQALAEGIFTRSARATDDALVLVARYLGAGI